MDIKTNYLENAFPFRSSRSHFTRSQSSPADQTDTLDYNKFHDDLFKLLCKRSSPIDSMSEFRSNGFDADLDDNDASYVVNYGSVLGGVGSKSIAGQFRATNSQISLTSSEHSRRRESYTNDIEKMKVVNILNELPISSLKQMASLPPELLWAAVVEASNARNNPIRTIKKQFSTGDCGFCKNNGERESFYSSHALKDVYGRVTCPILRAYRCERCGVTGDNAHTVKYCPLAEGAEIASTALLLKSSRLSSGKKRTSGNRLKVGTQSPSPMLQRFCR